MKILTIIIYACFAFTIASAQFKNEATISAASNTYLVIDDLDFVNNGSFSQTNGIVKFTGATNKNISGNNAIQFYKLDLAKTGTAQLVLQRNISVDNEINFTSGLLNLNNYNILLSSNALLVNENEDNRIIGSTGGYIEINTSLTAPSSSNPGNLGAIISSSSNFGNTIIRRGHQSQTNGNGGGNSILRYYDILPTNNSGLNGTLRFQYFDAELNSLDENSLVLWKSADNTSWTEMGFTSRNTINNYVELNNINDFSRWTLSNTGNALPVQWNSFNVQCLGNSIRINWQTEMEVNSRYFIIQTSNNAVSWLNGDTIAAAGNSNTPLFYSHNIISTNSGTNYYRILQQDINGSFKLSPVLRTNCDIKNLFTVYPNPTRNEVWVSVQSATNENTELIIYDNYGRLAKKQSRKLQAGVNLFTIDLSRLPAGIYTLLLRQNTMLRVFKLEKL
jgi:hypothetical protein